MAISWFVCPYKTHTGFSENYRRYCAIQDFDAQIRADGGAWSESEINGNHAIVKVRASIATLVAIAADPSIVRIPLLLLDASLGDLTVSQRTNIRTKLLTLVQDSVDFTTKFPDLSVVTLRQILKYITANRKETRYDPIANMVLMDGPDKPCRQPEDLNKEVQ